LVLSFLKHVPLTFEVRDLWPESAVALGEFQPKDNSMVTKLKNYAIEGQSKLSLSPMVYMTGCVKEDIT